MLFGNRWSYHDFAWKRHPWKAELFTSKDAAGSPLCETLNYLKQWSSTGAVAGHTRLPQNVNGFTKCTHLKLLTSERGPVRTESDRWLDCQPLQTSQSIIHCSAVIQNQIILHLRPLYAMDPPVNSSAPSRAFPGGDSSGLARLREVHLELRWMEACLFRCRNCHLSLFSCQLLDWVSNWVFLFASQESWRQFLVEIRTHSLVVKLWVLYFIVL